VPQTRIRTAIIQEKTHQCGATTVSAMLQATEFKKVKHKHLKQSTEIF
jgi:hypothetical protein